MESHAVLIAEITTLRTRLSEAEAENARLHLLYEAEKGLSAGFEAALKEAQERHAKSDACREENWKMVLAERSKREEAERVLSGPIREALEVAEEAIEGAPDNYSVEEFDHAYTLVHKALALLPSQEKPSDKEKPE